MATIYGNMCGFGICFLFYFEAKKLKRKEIFFLVLFLFFIFFFFSFFIFLVLSDEVKSKQKERITGKEERRDAVEGRRTRKPFFYWLSVE